MRKNLFLAAALFTLVCGLSFAQAPQVHIAGGNGDDAVYWLNGTRTVLPKTGGYASASAIAVSGSDVYIAGGDGGDAVYWLNGKRTVLPKSGGYASASAIAVSGSDVHIAGTDDSDAVYWLNGKRTVLPRTAGLDYADYARVAAIFVLGSNVYIVGGDGLQAVYWLNGKRVLLGSRSGSASFASAIAVSGSDVYIVGNYAGTGVYWLNGREISMTPALASPSAIAVSGSNIHIVSGPPTFDGGGYDRKQVPYWLNGKVTALPQSNQLAHTYAIAVSGSNVYIAGHDGADAVYWLNGTRTVLPKAGKEARARAIVVVSAAASAAPTAATTPAAAPTAAVQYNSESDFKVTKAGNGITITKYVGKATTVNIPPVIQNLPVTSIAKNAFKGTNITSVTIPDSVTSIGDYAFVNCNSLTSITFEGSIPSSNIGKIEIVTLMPYGQSNLRDGYLARGAGTYTRSLDNYGLFWSYAP